MGVGDLEVGGGGWVFCAGYEALDVEQVAGGGLDLVADVEVADLPLLTVGTVPEGVVLGGRDPLTVRWRHPAVAQTLFIRRRATYSGKYCEAL